jgi:hypothetical protein
VADLVTGWSAPASNLQVDLRMAMRFPLSCALRVSWSDANGLARHQTASGLDLSEHGAAFLIAAPLPVSAVVHLELPNSRQAVSAQVRSCKHSFGLWRVGVKLTGGFASMA